ncbi:hypothetical protein HBZ11_001759 [Salmonella enterica]|nr:hypothetical protein [Salmonella enterica subsp. arizonae]EEP5102208.1 hypothetical protein [Salmonella enterica]
MADIENIKSDNFWDEVIHRSKNQLHDMNVRSFHEWRSTTGDREVNRLLNLMELLLSPDNHPFEIKFFIELINYRVHGSMLFSCFKSSGKTIIKQGMKGDIYCLPVLYVIIRYLIDNSPIGSPDYSKQEIDIRKLFQSNFTH